LILPDSCGNDENVLKTAFYEISKILKYFSKKNQELESLPFWNTPIP